MGPKQLAGVMEIVMRAGAERRGIEVDEEALAAGTKAVEEQIEVESDAFVASGELWDDGIIDPRKSRAVLALSLSAALNAPIEPTRFGLFRM